MGPCECKIVQLTHAMIKIIENGDSAAITHSLGKLGFSSRVDAYIDREMIACDFVLALVVDLDVA